MFRAYLAVPALLLVLVQPSHAFSSMCCGNDLVSPGDHVVEVLARCGEPAYVDERVIYHVKKVRHRHPHGGKDVHVRKEKHVPVPAETWVYNFGPNRFMQEVWFLDRRLHRVRTLGRGFALPDDSSGVVGTRSGRLDH